ncbi:Hsp20/alpha crystallin family protein [Streptomyces sp. NPDC051917]|uniref:Hsp20/alpha crystallin family protein n=1 Tax=Streptomyces sp. NPDC051917 TaxID=3154754 RepID=UPI0034556713
MSRLPSGTFSPLADLQESGETYVVEAELPGIKREDIDVEVSERELCITGEYKEREREGVLRRSTRRTGRFEYRALLPAVRVPIKHPCWSCGMSVLLEDSADSIVSTDVETSDPVLIIDLCG